MSIIEGTNLKDKLKGVNDENNTIYGFGNDDILIGGKYKDDLIGGLGNDTITGGLGQNTVIYTKGDGSDIINITKNEDLTLDLYEYENDLDDLGFVYSSNKKDLIIYEISSNQEIITLKDFTKNDKAKSIKLMFDGDSTTAINLKTQLYDVGLIDKNFTGSYLKEKIDASSYKKYKDKAKTIVDTDTTKKGLTLDGKDGNDVITGSMYSDTIKGGNGDDKIYGSTGYDSINGGIGQNTIYYTSLNQLNGDKINLTKGERLNIDISGITGAAATYRVNGKNLDVTVTQGSTSRTFTIINFGKKDVTNNETKTTYDTSYVLLTTDSEVIDLKTVTLTEVKIEKNYTGTWHAEDINASGYKKYKDKAKTIVDTDTTKTGLTIKGEGGNDIITGSIYSDTIKGGDGNDTIIGGKGNDKLYGDAGNNTLEFNNGDGFDTVFSGKGKDSIKFNDTEQVLLQVDRKGNDLIIGHDRDENGAIKATVTIKNYYKTDKSGNIESSVKSIVTNEGTKTLSEFLKNHINPQYGNIIYGTEGKDVLIGLSSDDTIYGFGGDDILRGEAGNDTIYGGTGNDVITGGTGDDSLYGEGGYNKFIFYAGDGKDTIYNSTINDKLQLITGYYDISVFSRSGNSLVITRVTDSITISDFFNLESKINTIEIIDSEGTIQAVKTIKNDSTINVDLSQYSTEYVYQGTNYKENFTGSGSLKNLGTDDRLTFESSTTYSLDNNDGLTISGGNEITIKDYNYQNNTLPTVYVGTSDTPESVTAKTLYVSGFNSFDCKSEKISTFNSYDVTGTDGNDTLNGSIKNDTLRGGAGDDTITGDKGADTLIGGTGSDTYKIANTDGIDNVYVQSGNENDDEDTIHFTGKTIDELTVTVTDSETVHDTELKIDDDNKVILKDYINKDTDLTVKDKNGKEYNFVTDSSKYDQHTAAADDHQAMYGSANGDTILGGAGDDYIEGRAGDDTITGGAGNDLMIGGTGDDTITGEAGDDTIIGGEGNDSLTGDAGSNLYIFENGSGDDDVYTTSGTDTLKYEDTDIRDITVAVGTDTVLTTNNFDSVTLKDYDNTLTNLEITDKNNVSYNFVTHSSRFDQSESEVNQAIYGTSGDDTIKGGSGNDYIIGNDGDDTITGGAGNDYIKGSDGDDTITGGEGNDTLIGGDGDNTYIFTNGSGDDDVYTTSGTDTLQYQNANIKNITVTTEEETVLTTANNDKVTLKDYVNKDTALNIKDSSGNIYNFVTDSTLFDKSGQVANQAIYGTSDNDTIKGGSGNDYIIGNDGDDTITGGAGNDILIGGDGTNTYIFANGSGEDDVYTTSGDTLKYNDTNIRNISLVVGTDTVLTTDNSDVVNVKNYDNETTVLKIKDKTNTSYNVVTFADYYDQHESSESQAIYGTDGNNVIKGSTNDDYINGRAGDDEITGGYGNDILVGGAGSNTFILSNGSGNDDVYTTSGTDTLKYTNVNIKNITVTTGTDTVLTTGNNDTVTLKDYDNKITDLTVEDSTETEYNFVTHFSKFNQFESDRHQAIYGTSGNDTIIGGAMSDYIIGNGGNDSITGGEGNDTLIGGAGDNTYVFSNGSGIDEVYTTSGTDILHYQSTNIRSLSISYETTEEGTDTILTTNNNDKVKLKNYSNKDTEVNIKDTNGNIYNFVTDSTLFDKSGDTNKQAIYGTAGADNIYGGLSNDFICAGAGNDRVWGGVGNDYIDGGSGNNYLYGGTGDDEIYGGSGNDYIDGGYGNDNITGGAGNDTLIGDTGNDTIDGGDGDDNITGGAGNDTLTGGAGTNTFMFTYNTDIDTVYTTSGLDTLNFQQTKIEKLTVSRSGNDIWITNDNEANIDRVILKNYDNANVDLTIKDSASVLYNFVTDSGKFDQSESTANQAMYGTSSGETIKGGSGNDCIVANEGDDTIFGGAGADRIYAISGTNYITGGKGNDKLYSGTYKNHYRFANGDGDDELEVNVSSNLEVLKFTDLSDITGIYISMDANTKTIRYTSDDSITITNNDVVTEDHPIYFENSTGTRYQLYTGINEIYRSEKTNNQYIYGFVDILHDTGVDITSGTGNDILIGTFKDDTIKGGNGNDYINGNNGDDEINGGRGNDILYGDDGADKIYGDEGDDELYGGRGDDWLIGGSGSDTMYGGEGDDSYSLDTDSGIDTIYIDEGNDYGTDTLKYGSVSLDNLTVSHLYVDETFSTKIAVDADNYVTLVGYNNTTTALNINSLGQTYNFITNYENLTTVSGVKNKNNAIYNVLDTNTATINANNKNDYIYGKNSDTVYAWGGTDKVNYSTATETVTVYSGINQAKDYVSNSNVTVDLGSGNDIIYTALGSNITSTVNGNGGDDTLYIKDNASGFDNIHIVFNVERDDASSLTDVYVLNNTNVNKWLYGDTYKGTTIKNNNIETIVANDDKYITSTGAGTDSITTLAETVAAWLNTYIGTETGTTFDSVNSLITDGSADDKTALLAQFDTLTWTTP